MSCFSSSCTWFLLLVWNRPENPWQLASTFLQHCFYSMLPCLPTPWFGMKCTYSSIVGHWLASGSREHIVSKSSHTSLTDSFGNKISRFWILFLKQDFTMWLRLTLTLLPQPLKCWGFRYPSPCPAGSCILKHFGNIDPLSLLKAA